jgi:hypothetical protein
VLQGEVDGGAKAEWLGRRVVRGEGDGQGDEYTSEKRERSRSPNSRSLAD